MIALALAYLLGAVLGQNPHGEGARQSGNDAEVTIRGILQELPSESPLRRQLLTGARGNGIHRAWMDDMREIGIRKATVWITIQFNRTGRPKQMTVSRTEFYEDYDGLMRVSDENRLKGIRASGLEQTFNHLAEQRAGHGGWIDVPRPKPKPFTGAAKVEFFDNEWLPVQSEPLYCAGTQCVSEPRVH